MGPRSYPRSRLRYCFGFGFGHCCCPTTAVLSAPSAPPAFSAFSASPRRPGTLFCVSVRSPHRRLLLLPPLLPLLLPSRLRERLQQHLATVAHPPYVVKYMGEPQLGLYKA